MAMEKLGRNEPCHCGSGKKYKNCHMEMEAGKAGKSKTFLIGAIIIAFIIIAAVGLFFDAQRGGSGPPPGPAPAGKVWSEEHGHYH